MLEFQTLKRLKLISKRSKTGTHFLGCDNSILPLKTSLSYSAHLINVWPKRLNEVILEKQVAILHSFGTDGCVYVFIEGRVRKQTFSSSLFLAVSQPCRL